MSVFDKFRTAEGAINIFRASKQPMKGLPAAKNYQGRLTGISFQENKDAPEDFFQSRLQIEFTVTLAGGHPEFKGRKHWATFFMSPRDGEEVSQGLQVLMSMYANLIGQPLKVVRETPVTSDEEFRNFVDTMVQEIDEKAREGATVWTFDLTENKKNPDYPYTKIKGLVQ